MAKNEVKTSIGKTIGTIALLIFLYPAGIIMMWAISGWHIAAKVCVTVYYTLLTIGAIVFIAIGVSQMKDPYTNSYSAPSSTVSNVASESTDANEEIDDNSLNDIHELPEPNTSSMVDYIYNQVQDELESDGVDTEKIELAIEFAVKNYPNYFESNELMEQTMYYGNYLEYSCEMNSDENLLGQDLVHAVKYVYRDVETIEDSATQFKLSQIKESLANLGFGLEESSVTTETTTNNIVSSEFTSALNKAKIYSDTMHMSKIGIFEQLTSAIGEGFEVDAAQYAVDNVDADWNSNALKKATTYSTTMHMSKAAIYDQLISDMGEKYTAEEAQYAIDNMTANWNENALKKATTYSTTMNMSKTAIYEQLISDYGEKFTAEEAQYAIDNLQ